MTKKLIAAAGIVGFLASAGAAFAQTTATVEATTTATDTTTPRTQPMVLEVNKNGGILLRGTVSSVSSDSVTVKSWGGDWTVTVPSSAKVLPEGAAIGSFQTGDFVGVEGTVDSSASWTINAKLIRDWTARQALHQQIKANVQSVHTTIASGPRVIQGKVSGLDATARTFTLTNASGTTYSVTLDSGAKLLAKNWATLDFNKVSDGDTVRVYGTVASSTISASVFRDISVK
ncbi:MAG: hypothetical protein ACYC1Y_00665 [Minisyncoccota bacterium]